MEEVRTVDFKPNFWDYEEVDNELVIHIGGLTEDHKTVYTKVKGFTPYVYLELPKRIKWTDTKCKILYEYIKNVCEIKPVNYVLCKRYLLHYKVEVKVMMITFPGLKGCRDLNTKLSYRNVNLHEIDYFKQGEFTVHEANIDPIIKFTAQKNIQLANWLTVKETIHEDDEGLDESERKFSNADIDLWCDWRDVNVKDLKDGIGKQVRLKYASFDIETYSHNHNAKLPNPDIPQNIVFQISIRFGRFGDAPELRKRYMISLYDPYDIDGVIMIRCKNEKELLLKFTEIINLENPDCFVGYNIMKFDWNYMIVRAEKLKIMSKFTEISRLLGEQASKQEIKWDSKAYGNQIFHYLSARGRLNIDVLLEIERNYKLSKYSLDAVSEFFLGKHKEDVTPQQLFMLVLLTQEFLEYTKGKLSAKKLLEARVRIKEILIPRKCHGVVKELREELLRAKTGSELHKVVRKAITITAVYCDTDTNLPIDLIEKLNLVITMEEMSNCMHVPMSYLHTRGQQIKVLAQVYREGIVDKIIIPNRPKTDEVEKYQGAIVVEANPGDYDLVLCEDFESLYPTSMIAGNIDYTTILKDDDPTPDSECNIYEWEDHKGCIHDTTKRKVKIKASDILCKKHRYRYKKVIIFEDGSREGEGLLPRLERKLLTERKAVKKLMAKLEATLKMNAGLCTEDDLNYYRKMGWKIIEKDSLSEQERKEMEVQVKVLDAKQKALKVSANSAYGSLGAGKGYIPLIQGAATVTYIGRLSITETIKYIKRHYPFARIVYGDTDSVMVHLEGKSVEESFDLAEEISVRVSNYMKCMFCGFDEDISFMINGVSKKIKTITDDDMKYLSKEDKIKVFRYRSIPTNLTFENMYGRYLLLTKKRYIADVINKKGEITNKVKKGVVLARRDNCGWLRDAYASVVKSIIAKENEQNVMYKIYDEIHKLFIRQVMDEKLVLYKSIGILQNYAKKEEIKSKDGKTSCIAYIDDRGDGFTDCTGPLDSRLVWHGIQSHVHLALKMCRRGDDVPPNTRLEFLYLDTGIKDELQGQKIEDYNYYKENKSLGLKPDYIYYIDHQFMKPITELLNVIYPRKTVTIPKIVKKGKEEFEKLEDTIERLMLTLNEYQTKEVKYEKIGKSKKFEKQVNEVFKNMERKKVFKDCDKMDSKWSIVGSDGKTYYYKSENNEGPHTIFKCTHDELIRKCLIFKSNLVLDKVYERFGLKKRTKPRITKRNTDKYEIDDKIIEKIVVYRTNYNETIKELKKLFSPVVYI